ncbi:MAG: hypothetical protein ACKVTZ_08415 [Bacteroidia bacterium]
MKWKKLGRIFVTNAQHPKLLTHAANPLPVFLENNTYRFFYSSRDEKQRSSVSFVDIDIEKLTIIYQPKEPLLVHGAAASFYSHGISIGNMYRVGNECFILFMGWQIRENTHWRGEIGQLKLTDNCKLEVVGDAPFMGLDEEDSVSLSYPYVMFHEGIYKMWYGSTITWQTENGEMLHVIKYATSSDGKNWVKQGFAIPYQLGVAQAFSRPTVMVDENGYKMWYSYRDGKGTKYRIGYAHSVDGLVWENRLAETGITVSPSGWDSEMICYPFVFEHNGRYYMAYNGNEYGKTGFGIAVSS